MFAPVLMRESKTRLLPNVNSENLDQTTRNSF